MSYPDEIYIQPGNKLSEMDLDRLLILLDEIDDDSRSQKKLLESCLTKLVENIFKLQYWEMELGRDCQHWQAMVCDARNDIEMLLDHNPRLKSYMERVYPQLYRHTIDLCQEEFYVSKNFTIELEQILRSNYFG